VLADTPLTGGLEPMLGSLHLRTLTILGFPNLSRPGILDALNHQDFGYRWVTRFIALDKTDATKALTRLRRQWFNKRKSVTAMLREVIYNQPVQLLDSDADNKTADADLALQALGGDHVAFGHLTTTITVADEDRARVEDKVRAVERIVNGLGFTCIREGLNAVEAWLSSLPGQVYANVRQPLVHTLNLAHLMPLSSVWAGPARNRHLDGPPLLYAETSGSTPFRLSTHVGDVGHMMIVGPTGAGKSVLLALIALQFRRYPGSQLYIFDMGRSAQAAVLAMGGAHHGLGLGGDAGETIAFQPLAGIGDAGERAWAAEWIAALLAHEKVVVTPEVKEAVWSALASLASAPVEERTLTGLSLLLQSTALRSALAPYTLEGPFGRLLDAAEDDLRMADVQCFETEALMGVRQRRRARPDLSVPPARGAVHRPPDIADPRRGLEVPRPSAVRGAHSRVAEDAAQEECRGDLREPEPRRHRGQRHRARHHRELPAAHPASQCRSDRAAGARGLSAVRAQRPADRARQPCDAQAALLPPVCDRQPPFRARARPVALELCGASDPATQARIDALLAAHGPVGFAARFLDDAGLDWAAALLAQFPDPQAKE
jgi:hypothetical protein